MATREENLKKINEELEKLSDEELDNVAGGGYSKEDVEKMTGAFGEKLKELGPSIQKLIGLFTNENANNNKV